MRTLHSIPAYYKAAVVGVGLMLIMVCVVGVSYLSIETGFGRGRQLVNEYYPALDTLLNVDRDLHAAQIALSNALPLQNASAREAYLREFETHVARANGRFRTFERMTAGLADGGGLKDTYRDRKDRWTAAVLEIAGNQDPSLYFDQFGVLLETFADTRTALNDIEEQLLQPMLEQGGETLVGDLRNAKTILFGALIVGLVLGGGLTVSGVRMIRRQHMAMLTEQQERDCESRRKEFDRRVHRALELVDDEEEALDVVRDAINEAITEDQQAELLLADASMSHLHRVAHSDAGENERGCSVSKLTDCPAIRRNSRLLFSSSNRFEACPRLKRRVPEGCSALCLPVSILGRTAGVVHVTGRVDELPSDEQSSSLQAAATLAGDRIGMIRAFERKDKQASTDALTGLLNRRSLEERIAAFEPDALYSVVFADIDHFKQLNDTHGHEAGDRALRVFGDILRSCLRPDDLPSRWGGEEFVLVLPGSARNGAALVLERIRERLAELLAVAGVVVPFTLSFGVCDSTQATDFDEIVRLADEALLRAKRSGRDRVVCHGQEIMDDGSVQGVAASDLPAAS